MRTLHTYYSVEPKASNCSPLLAFGFARYRIGGDGNWIWGELPLRRDFRLGQGRPGSLTERRKEEIHSEKS